jgi:hypothetical protein
LKRPDRHPPGVTHFGLGTRRGRQDVDSYSSPLSNVIGTTGAQRHNGKDPMTRLFRYSFDRRLVAFWGVFGVRPAKDGVTLRDDGRLRATFGFLKLETPLENVDGAHITRNYRWWTAAGARGSMKDDGLTFGTNANAGVCIHFREKVPSPLRRKGHSALTVTVEDLEGLTAALTGR